MTVRTGILLRVVVALTAAAGLLLIEDDTARTAFLVAVCAVALAAAWIEARSESPGAEGASFLVPIVAALVISSLVFENDEQKLASVIVLTLVFTLGLRAVRGRRGGFT